LLNQQSALNDSVKTKIILIPKKLYFGVLAPVKAIEGSFYVKNIGKRDFNIKEIISTCECVTTKHINSDVIHPNDSLKVNYQINTENVQGPFSNAIITIGNCEHGNETYFFEGSIH